MKKELLSLLILFIATGAMVSFSSSRKARAKKAADAKATFCTCNSVPSSSVSMRISGGSTDIFTWNEPTGGSTVESYNVGGYWSCGPGFGPITAYGTATELVYNPPATGTCNHGTMSIITECSDGFTNCSSSPTYFSW
jgi:hypothetical protein